MLLILALAACGPNERNFPEQYADERVHIDFLDYARLRYEIGSTSCEGDLDGYDLESTEDASFEEYVDSVSPCEFDKDAAVACLDDLRSIESCDDALDVYWASADGDQDDPPPGSYLFPSCAQACGIALTYKGGSGE